MKETLKIRHYIIGLLYEAGKTSVPLMSVRKMAKHFDVAQCTVSAAVKELIEDGYVITRPGVGMFTNPNKLSIARSESEPPLIGVIHGDGRYFYLDQSAWQSLSPLIGALVGRNFNVRQIFFESGDREEIFNEIILTPLDGLVWIDNPAPDETLLRRLLERKLPIIIDHESFDFVNVVGFDFMGMMTRLAGQLAAEGKQRLLWCMPDYETHTALPLVKQIFEQGRPGAEVVALIANAYDFAEELENALTGPPLDVVCSHRRYADLVRRHYLGTGVTPEYLNWRIITPEEAAAEKTGWVFSLAERGEAMAARMEQLLHHDQSVEKILLDMYLKREGDK